MVWKWTQMGLTWTEMRNGHASQSLYHSHINANQSHIRWWNFKSVCFWVSDILVKHAHKLQKWWTTQQGRVRRSKKDKLERGGLLLTKWCRLLCWKCYFFWPHHFGSLILRNYSIMTPRSTVFHFCTSLMYIMSRVNGGRNLPPIQVLAGLLY